ncbi:MAG: hypothetical protein M3512_05055 [Bacteroidota bacterium]|nr:hypothetical protein [Bacteroidota bacterium]
MENLVSQQVQALNRTNPQIEKIASMNGVDEKIIKKLDSAGWASEIKIFLEADINKPRLIGNYDKEETIEGNARTVWYHAINPKEVQIEYLKLLYEKEKLASIESVFKEKNLLYKTRRSIQMNFKEDNQGGPILSDYLIIGQQKMILKDTINYKIVAKISY